MSNCPQGLTPGFGVQPSISDAICATRANFGPDAGGLDIIVAGTGFLIKTEGQTSFVLTAAHNLYHPDYSLPALSMDLYFGRQGGAAAAQRAMTGGNYPAEYAQSYAPPEWDFGVVEVAALEPGFAPIPMAPSTAAGETGKLLVGYPNEGACADTFEAYHTNFSVAPAGGATYRYAGQTTYVGMSGGPLLARPGPGQPISSYGLHIRGEAPGEPDRPRGVRFSQQVLQRIQAWL